MKFQFLLALFTITIAFKTQAGTPEQDPVTRALRYSFAKAHLPSQSELRIGYKWTCTLRSALVDHNWTSETFNKYSFRMHEIAGVPVVQNSGNSFIQEYVYNSFGLAGLLIKGGSTGYEILRVEDTGMIILEHSVRGSFVDGHNAITMPVAKLPKDFRVLSYSTCQPEPLDSM